jgi:hypothetical protein
VRFFEHEEKYLADVMVTLEVREIGLTPEYFSDQVRKLFFSMREGLRGLVVWVEDERSVNIELHLVFIWVLWEVSPAVRLLAFRLDGDIVVRTKKQGPCY